MAEAITSWTATAASNTTVDGINIAENCPAANMNDAVRAVMASIKYGVRRGGEIAYSTLGNVAPTVESKSGNFTIQTTDNMKRYLVTAAATVTEGASAPVAGDTFTIVNSSSGLVTVALTVDGVSGYILSPGESAILHAAGSSAYRTLAASRYPDCFKAEMSASTGNVTGDGTDATVICGTEIYDYGGRYDQSTGIFTANRDGVYAFGANITLLGFLSGQDTYFKAVASNGTEYVHNLRPYAIAESGNAYVCSCYVEVEMEANDTFKWVVKVAGNASANISIRKTSTRATSVCGHFIRSK